MREVGTHRLHCDSENDGDNLRVVEVSDTDASFSDKLARFLA